MCSYDQRQPLHLPVDIPSEGKEKGALGPFFCDEITTRP
jgi:hypothetical protein